MIRSTSSLTVYRQHYLLAVVNILSSKDPHEVYAQDATFFCWVFSLLPFIPQLMGSESHNTYAAMHAHFIKARVFKLCKLSWSKQFLSLPSYLLWNKECSFHYKLILLKVYENYNLKWEFDPKLASLCVCVPAVPLALLKYLSVMEQTNLNVFIEYNRENLIN